MSVLKLTQVGEESILRRSREPLLRNSANFPRKFAIRGPSSRTFFGDVVRAVLLESKAIDCQVWSHIIKIGAGKGAEKWLWRLFIKNTVLC